jgi:hypothetical protein
MLLGQVVIGGSLESALYALVTDSYLIDRSPDPQLFYQKSEVPIFGLVSKSQIYAKIAFMLSLLGKRLPAKETDSIRVSENQLKIISGNTSFKYQFDSVVVFDPTGVDFDNKILISKEKTFQVIDDFELSVLGEKKTEIQSLSEDRDFVRQIHFYCSDRVDGANYITDCVAESELTQEQMYNFDYSDTMARFVVERHLQEVGVMGSFMNFYKNGTPKYRKPKVIHVKRIVKEKDNNLYEDSDTIKFVHFSVQEILDEQIT